MRTRAGVCAAVLLVAVFGLLLVVRPGSGAATVAGVGSCAAATGEVPGAAASRLEVRPMCALPAEAAVVWAQIRAGGPFRSDRDGVTFGNRESILPARPSGFYREYTVPTPGEGDRGARRLVTGGPLGPRQELYYTGDHYLSFVVVVVAAP